MLPQVFHRVIPLDNNVGSGNLWSVKVRPTHRVGWQDARVEGVQHSTDRTRLCPCGRPVSLSLRRDLCAVCHRERRHARATETRIERAFQLARLELRSQRKGALVMLFETLQQQLRSGELRTPQLNDENRRRFGLGPQVVVREAVASDRIVAVSDEEWSRRLLERRERRLA